MKIKIYQVDAFTENLFGGNTSAVCPLEHWIDDELMQKIASETNLSKTAFIVAKENSTYEIRWFTPEHEVALCDHAALASAYVIFNHLDFEHEILTLSAIGGDIVISKENDLFALSFPTYMPTLYKEYNPIFGLAMGIEPLKILSNKDFILVYENEEIIKNLKPKIDILRSVDLRGVCVTARGQHSDFVFRYFAPKLGVKEDLITGSVCSQLAPYWSQVLQKHELKANQISSNRCSELICDLVDHHVVIKGKATLFMKGKIIIEERATPREPNALPAKSKFAIAV